AEREHGANRRMQEADECVVCRRGRVVREVVVRGCVQIDATRHCEEQPDDERPEREREGREDEASTPAPREVAGATEGGEREERKQVGQGVEDADGTTDLVEVSRLEERDLAADVGGWDSREQVDARALELLSDERCNRREIDLDCAVARGGDTAGRL